MWNISEASSDHLHGHNICSKLSKCSAIIHCSHSNLEMCGDQWYWLSVEWFVFFCFFFYHRYNYMPRTRLCITYLSTTLTLLFDVFRPAKYRNLWVSDSDVFYLKLPLSVHPLTVLTPSGKWHPWKLRPKRLGFQHPDFSRRDIFDDTSFLWKSFGGNKNMEQRH